MESRLLPILERPTGTSSAGYPYLRLEAWEELRDRVPHLFAMGQACLAAIGRIEASREGDASDEADNVRRACRVVRQVVKTAAITAPPDLWLLRHVLGTMCGLGLLDRLCEGEAIYPARCRVDDGILRAQELETDLYFLLSRGLIEQYDESFRIAGHPRARRLLRSIGEVPVAIDPAPLWQRLFRGEALETGEQELLLDLGLRAPRRTEVAQNHWIPTLEEVELGYRLVPLVLGLRAAERTAALEQGAEVRPTDWSDVHPMCAGAALEVLTAAGWMGREGERFRVTELGARGLARGPGPFGIIHTYHPYMTRARDILLEGRGDVWVSRGENLGASQDANRGTFRRANDALDRFCDETGFRYRVFIEHAIGRGEATRQRYERSGDEVAYVGADLEDAAIDAAIAEQKAGRLPADMLFVRSADIGEPKVLLDALTERGLDARGAVMLVGNGFHEIRGQTDEGMIEVFRGYHDAGVLLLFTEENALSIDDLRATAWNTYHAGFKYVHEKSGQGLRPAEPRAHVRLGRPLRAAWSECARAAGYIRADAYCGRTRTIYPYKRASGSNPAISVSHFFVPAPIANELGLGSP